ncbi:MAG: histidinol dehydrogenase [Rickettsiales bacterium]
MIRLYASGGDFKRKMTEVFSARMSGDGDVSSVVSSIIDKVRSQGDKALFAYTKEFDSFDVTVENIRVTEKEKADAIALCSPELMKSLKMAAARIADYSKRQMPENLDYVDDVGVRLGHRWIPLDSAGLYVPGGLASYPSSVLMNAVIAKVAGVKRLVAVVPAPQGKLNPAVLAAAHVAGIDEIYKVGGAQAVAALAYGTDIIKAVDKIVGPGNAYVAEAKRQVFGKVGIDMIAGPSEILVIADDDNNPKWVAADLLSQAEHDAMAQAVLITDNEEFADKVITNVESILQDLPRRDIAGKSWVEHGVVIIVDDIRQAADISNEIAPEHLELMIRNPDELLPLLRHAGAIFLGSHTPEAIGDYIAGPSHVLPTSGTARFSSGLSVFDFLKRSSIIGCSEDAFKKLSHYTSTLADAEGLAAHSLSVNMRNYD